MEEKVSEESEHKEEAILRALAKGAAAPFEIAVRTFLFPDDLADPLAELEEKGLIISERLDMGQMYSITSAGRSKLTRQIRLP